MNIIFYESNYAQKGDITFLMPNSANYQAIDQGSGD